MGPWPHWFMQPALLMRTMPASPASLVSRFSVWKTETPPAFSQVLPKEQTKT